MVDASNITYDIEIYDSQRPVYSARRVAGNPLVQERRRAQGDRRVRGSPGQLAASWRRPGPLAQGRLGGVTRRHVEYRVGAERETSTVVDRGARDPVQHHLDVTEPTLS